MCRSPSRTCWPSLPSTSSRTNSAQNKWTARNVYFPCMRSKLKAGILAVSAVAVTSASCDVRHIETGPMQTDPVAVELGKADHADLDLKLGAGELDVAGGADKLIDGEFEYNVADWKPKVSTSVIGSHTTITIEQPPHAGFNGNPHYRWNLKLNDHAIFDVALHMGAGQANLNLGDLQLRDVVVEIGAGKVDVDLRGKPTRDYDVRISGGVGQAIVRLPHDVGIWAEAHGGLGNLTVDGLEKRDDHYQNSL